MKLKAYREQTDLRQSPARAIATASMASRPDWGQIFRIPPVEPGKATDQPALSLAGLRRDYGERTALEGIGLELARGETLLVLGPNGAGKTTLLRILATLLRPSGGEVRALGCSLPDEAWKLRGRIGFLGHEPLLYRDLSGRENLRFHARLHGLTGETGEVRIGELLAAVGMARRAEQRVAELSAGMRQRLAIARCVLHRPELLLLDEPDSNLDAEGRDLARSLIGPGEGLTRVIVSHDPERFEAEADQVLRLEAGGKVAVR
jgi:heme exporter protein A